MRLKLLIAPVLLKDEIVIGADSKVTDTFGYDLNKRACKILPGRKSFSGILGLEIDRQTGFNAPRDCDSSLKA